MTSQKCPFIILKKISVKEVQDFDSEKAWTLADFGMAKTNTKEANTILPEISETKSISGELSSNSLRNEAEVFPPSVKDAVTVFGLEGRCILDARIPNNSSKEFGVIVQDVVKIERVPRELSDETLVSEGGVNSCNVKDEKIEIKFRKSPELEETSLLTGLDVKLKRENEDEKGITRELVGFFSGSEEGEDRKSRREVKGENDVKIVKKENSSDGEDVCNNEQIINEKSVNGSQRQSGVHDPSAIKLLNVSVTLEDLFPSYLRKLGKAHSNTESCLCIFCRGEYRCSKALQRFSQGSQKKDRLMHSQNRDDKFGKNLESQRGPNLKVHQEVPRNKRVFRCDKCTLKCEDSNALSIHLRVHGKLYRCKSCPAQFALMSSHYAHMELHSDKTFKCKHCPKAFWHRSVFETHLRVHSKEKPFECNQCSAKFTQEGALKAHMSVHKAERLFKCPQCPADFKFKSNLTVHLRRHSGEKPFKCKHCPLKCMTSTNLKNHMRLHTGEKPFKCKLCPLKFTQSSAVNTHFRNVHSEKRPFECKFCLAKFKQTSSLNTHLRVHTGEKPYKCKLCPFECAQSSGLHTHLKVHSSERPFECKLCSARFKLKIGLMEHSTVHSNKKPFTCNQCPAKFKRKKGLNKHVRLHSGEKPFVCTMCPRKFMRKRSLTSHLRRHTVERPLSCAHCSLKFNEKHDLIPHLRKCLKTTVIANC